MYCSFVGELTSLYRSRTRFFSSTLSEWAILERAAIVASNAGARVGVHFDE